LQRGLKWSACHPNGVPTFNPTGPTSFVLKKLYVSKEERKKKGKKE